MSPILCANRFFEGKYEEGPGRFYYWFKNYIVYTSLCALPIFATGALVYFGIEGSAFGRSTKRLALLPLSLEDMSFLAR